MAALIPGAPRGQERRSPRSADDEKIGIGRRIFFTRRGTQLLLRPGTAELSVDPIYQQTWGSICAELVRRGVLQIRSTRLIKRVDGFGKEEDIPVGGGKRKLTRIPAYIGDAYLEAIGLEVYRSKVKSISRRTRSGRLQIVELSLGVAMRASHFLAGAPDFQPLCKPLSAEITDALSHARKWSGASRDDQRAVVAAAIDACLRSTEISQSWLAKAAPRPFQGARTQRDRLVNDWAVRIVQAIRDENPS